MMDEILVQRFDALDNKIDMLLESQKEIARDVKDDREKVIRMEQSVIIYERMFADHIKCHDEQCKKNHKALYDNIFRIALTAITVITISVVGFFASKYFTQEQVIAKQPQQKE